MDNRQKRRIDKTRVILKKNSKLFYASIRVDSQLLTLKSTILIRSDSDDEDVNAMVIAIFYDTITKKMMFYLRCFIPELDLVTSRPYSNRLLLTSHLISEPVENFIKTIKVMYSSQRESNSEHDYICGGMIDGMSFDLRTITSKNDFQYYELPKMSFTEREGYPNDAILLDAFNEIYPSFEVNYARILAKEFYHTSSFIPIDEESLLTCEYDSDVESGSENWVNELQRVYLDDVVDVSPSETDYIVKWNSHVDRYEKLPKKELLKSFIKDNEMELSRDYAFNINFRVMLMTLMKKDLISAADVYELLKNKEE